STLRPVMGPLWRATCLGAAVLVVAGFFFLPPVMKEARARRALDGALASAGGEAGAARQPDVMVARLLEVERDWPGTGAARRAAAMRPLYEGLAAAHALYPVRGCLDILRQAGRSIEEYRQKNGRPPAALADLPLEGPAKVDPWGRPIRYRVSEGHYELSS